MDRPRRALVEEPDDVESYVARRSRGFTPADDGDHLATRPARAARALEPPVITHPSPESDQLGFSDPVPRPRRALLPETPRPGPPRPEPLLPDADKEKTTAAEAGIGRRAMDPLPSRYAEPAVRLEPAAPAAPTPSVTSPQPRRSAPLPSFEPVIERAPANGHGTSPDNPSPARPQPPQPPAPVAPPRVSMPSPVPTAPLVSPRLTPASANVPPPPMSRAATQGDCVPAPASSGERDPARVRGHSDIIIRADACSRVMAGPDATADIAAGTRTSDDANGLCAPTASASAIDAATSFARRSAERPFGAVATAARCRPPRHHKGRRTPWHALTLGR